MQNGPSKFCFLYVNECRMGLWPIFRAHLYSGPEISLCPQILLVADIVDFIHRELVAVIAYSVHREY